MKITFPKIIFSRKWIALSIIIFIITGFVVGYFYIQNKYIVEPVAVGEIIPSFKVYRLDNREVKIDTLIHKNILIAFISTECQHCKNEVHALMQLQSLIEDSVTIIAISTNDVKETIDFIGETKVTFPIYLDSNAEARKAFHVLPMPVVYFLDNKRSVLRFIAGEQTKEKLFAALAVFDHVK